MFLHDNRRLTALMLAALLTNTSAPAEAEGVGVDLRPIEQVGFNSAINIIPPRSSWINVKFLGITRQALDYTCAAASFATLVRSRFALELSEADLVKAMLDRLGQDKVDLVIQSGFSMLDIKRLAELNGFAASGYKVSPDMLSALRRPVIAQVVLFDRKHFVVLFPPESGWVPILDPARGKLRLPLDRFNSTWTGFVLDVNRPGEPPLVGRMFGDSPENASISEAPLHALEIDSIWRERWFAR